MAETRTPIISFKNFSFQYRAQKQPTLHDINLDIYPGERVLIAGPSGSGKSTLAACINGLNPFSYPGKCTGTLTVDGVDAPHSSIFELAGHVGTVLQDPDGQFIGLTVGEDIAFALENSCTPQDEMHEITRRAAGLVGIESHLDYAPHELSGGQKQRVSLAGVMVDEVKILLFDEPLANLDPATGKQAIELIDTIQQKTDTTVLIIEHRLEDVLWRSVDRIVLVNEGRILADLRPDELLSGALLAENGIREPLYVTAMRYAGIDITPAKHPAHVDSVVLDDADTEKLRAWFRAEPLPAATPAPTPRTLMEGITPMPIASSYMTYYAIQTDGTLIGWGENLRGLINYPDSLPSYEDAVVMMEDVAAVYAGDWVTLILCSDGTLWGVGSGLFGLLPERAASQDAYDPLFLMSDVVMAAVSSESACALRSGVGAARRDFSRNRS